MLNNITKTVENENIQEINGNDNVQNIVNIDMDIQNVLNIIQNQNVQLMVEQYMHDNLARFQNLLLSNIDYDTLVKQTLQSPEIVLIINKTIKIVSENGDKIDFDVLIKLLSERIKNNDNYSFINVVLSQAVDKIDKVTNRHISILGLIHFNQKIIVKDLKSLDELDNNFKQLNSVMTDIENTSESEIGYLASLGLLSITTIESENSQSKFFMTYGYIDSSLEQTAFLEQLANYKNINNILEIYKKKQLSKARLTTVGEAIALSHLKKVFDLDISKWIK